MVVSRLDIDLLFEDKMPWVLVLSQNLVLISIGFFFVIVYESHKAEAPASPGLLVSHHNGITNLPELGEISEQVIF